MSFARTTLPGLLMAACLSAALAVCAADRREARAVSSFKAVGVSAPITVYLSQGDAESLALEGEAGALAELETVVEDGSLKLRQKSRDRVPGMGKVKAYLTVRTLDALAVSGSGDVIAPSLRTGDLQIAISGSGNVSIAQLAAAKLDVHVSGSGDLQVSGKADSLASSISGSGSVKAARLEVADARVSIAGSGDITMWVRTRLSASVAGSGDVRYYGDPSVRRSIAGSGSIKRLGATPS